mgnify:FL=1
MTNLEQSYAQYDQARAAIQRIRTRREELKPIVGAWQRSQDSLRYDVPEPVEARDEYARLGAELYAAANGFEELQQQIARLEGLALRAMEMIASDTASIEQLERSTHPIAPEQAEQIRRWRANRQRELDHIGTPRAMAAAPEQVAA